MQTVWATESDNSVFRDVTNTYFFLSFTDKVVVCSTFLVPTQIKFFNWPMLILDSERSDECVNFTMLCVCVFFLLYTRTCRNNASISNFRGGF
ncbi:Uncharacterized protein FWK35_00032464 [Aphis craccivora]|uniref:Uncharacterized protein n=1 Tax=Aphis craccivora TaxID=307492 RepID=A0A6G0Y067_APHCR|nr:Uncharacterized protein FWK35_00032464 [Aphis craccivora]